MHVAIIIISVISALAAIYIIMIKPRTGYPFPKELTAVDYAHRGIYDNEDGDGENTLSAFSSASETGYGIELDVRLSSDGKVVVFHDSTLDRLCKRADRVDSLTAAELAGMKIGKNEGKIPLFEEVLENIDPTTPLCVELKGENVDTTLCKKVAEILDGYKGYFSVESFNPFLLSWFRKNRPEYIRGQLVTDLFREKNTSFVIAFFCSHMLLNCISRPDYISCDVEHRKNLSVVICERIFRSTMFSWTVDTDEKYAEARMRGDVTIFQNINPPIPRNVENNRRE